MRKYTQQLLILLILLLHTKYSTWIFSLKPGKYEEINL